MRSPWIIGLLSIIPGLGFFVLGKPRRGLGVLGFLFALLFIFLFIPGDFTTQVSFQLMILVWIGQIVLAVQSARLYKRQQAGEVSLLREKEKIVPPSGLTGMERQAYKIRETVRHQLYPGENLHGAVIAQSTPGYTLGTKMYYIGLTDDSLVMIELDSFGEQVDLIRIPLADIKSTSHKNKFPLDHWVLGLGDNKHLKLYVNFRLRTLTTEIIKKLKALRI